jgi:hypothetical protein
VRDQRSPISVGITFSVFLIATLIRRLRSTTRTARHAGNMQLLLIKREFLYKLFENYFLCLFSRRLAANILNKQPRTNDKGLSSSLRVGCGANNP